MKKRNSSEDEYNAFSHASRHRLIFPRITELTSFSRAMQRLACFPAHNRACNRLGPSSQIYSRKGIWKGNLTRAVTAHTEKQLGRSLELASFPVHNRAHKFFLHYAAASMFSCAAVQTEPASFACKFSRAMQRLALRLSRAFTHTCSLT